MFLPLVASLAIFGGLFMSEKEPVNLALQAKASASEDFGPQLKAEFANDGKPETRWSGISGHNSGVWFQLDWPTPVTMREVVIQQYDTYVKELDVQVWDAVKNDWHTIQHFGKPTAKLPKVIVATFAPVSTNKLRIGNITNGPSFTEVEVYAQPIPPVTVLGSDANGNVLGIVCDKWGRSPFAGAAVELSGQSKTGEWKGSAKTDAHGLFTIPMPLGLHGSLSVKTTAGEFEYGQDHPSEDLQYGLTPTSYGSRPTSLSGKWRFSVDPPADFFQPSFDDTKWHDIEVPAHWEMQGFRSIKGIGGYRKHFTAPKGSGRLKLRFDGVYSGAEVWLNGKRIAYHEGGALPFEIDVTDVAVTGDNVLALLVTEHTRTSDELDKMSIYADVPLGGIMRKVTLFRVPEAHIGALAVATPFDSKYVDATVTGTASVLNESGTPLKNLTLSAKVTDSKGAVVATSKPEAFASQAWQRTEVPVTVEVKAPKKWNAEEPNLYNLTLEIRDGDKLIQTLTKRIGFRQTEIKGTKILINGQEVKVRGTCHHDSDPLLGRAVTPALEKLDLQLIKEANLNSIRTSHYTPIPEMIDFADEMGIYVEDEGSFCWAGTTDDLRLTPRVMQLNCELVARDRNHPSVFIWSICNESTVGYGLWRSREWVQKADPSRPTTASYQADGSMDTGIRHNPMTLQEMTEIERDLKVPVIWDECWCIWQDIWGDYAEVYNDPGIRDYYVKPYIGLYDHFIHSPVVQGTEIWAWSDDIFLLPNAGLEYGREDTPGHYMHEQYQMPGRGLTGDAQWGVVDAWRRRKPEFWHTKKLHSPIKVVEGPVQLSGKTAHIAVENQYDFLNLSSVAISWTLGADKGIAQSSLAPHQRGDIVIDLPRTPSSGELLSLEFKLDGALVDAYKLPIGSRSVAPKLAKVAPKPLQATTSDNLNGHSEFIVGNGFEFGFATTYGNLRRGVLDGQSVLRSMPRLSISPTGNPLRPIPDPLTWVLASFDVKPSGTDYLVKIDGQYDKLKGGYEYVIKPDGEVVATADFTYDGPDVKVREIGLLFEVPREADLLTWNRNAEFSVYPDDHIGRPEGSARAFAVHGKTLPPKWGWSSDNTSMGSNDFRSTKRSINWGRIGYPDGPGVLVESDGKQNLRAWVNDERIAVYVTDFYDGIGSRYEWTANYGEGRLLKKGDKLRCTVRLRLSPSAK